MQGKWQCRCVVWIINWALQIHCNPRVPLGAIKLVSEDWTKRDHRGLKRIYGIWYSFCILGKSFARPFEGKQIAVLWSCFFYDEIICFWFQTTKNDWVWRKVLESYIFILSVLDDIVGVLFFQLVSLFKKLDSKFESFFTE